MITRAPFLALHPSGTLEEKRASLTAIGAQLAGRGKALSQMEGQLGEQQRNLDRLTGGSGALNVCACTVGCSHWAACSSVMGPKLLRPRQSRITHVQHARGHEKVDVSAWI